MYVRVPIADVRLNGIIWRSKTLKTALRCQLRREAYFILKHALCTFLRQRLVFLRALKAFEIETFANRQKSEFSCVYSVFRVIGKSSTKRNR